MKYFKAIICTLLIVILLSGCSFRMSSSIEDLISPISPFGENADIQEALNKFATNGYTLKTPSGGDFNASYNFYDIYADGTDEAFAFYEPADDLGTICMAVIKKDNDSWSVVDNIKGDGKEVYSISFEDINSDNVNEVIICWDAISNSSNHIMSIYKINDDKFSQIGDPISINNYTSVDFDKDGKNELLLFEINGASSSVKAELYSLENNKFKLLGQTKLDSHVASYTNIQIENAENDVRVYADAIGSDGSSMLTEIIYWSNSYDSIVSPFYSYNTGLTKETKRNLVIPSIDINGDSLIDIPTQFKGISKLPKYVNAVNWMIYKNTVLVHSAYSLVVDDGYLVVIPDKYFKSISVEYDEKSKEMTVINKSTKNEVFSIIPVLKASFEENGYKGYSIILEESGYYYLAKTGNDSDIQITIDELKDYVKSIN